jgi:hypothetical protein
MAAASIAIIVKGTAVPWVVGFGPMPFRSAGIMGPTLAFAALARVPWLAHRPE